MDAHFHVKVVGVFVRFRAPLQKHNLWQRIKKGLVYADGSINLKSWKMMKQVD
jgi:hypothetical protein